MGLLESVCEVLEWRGSVVITFWNEAVLWLLFYNITIMCGKFVLRCINPFVLLLETTEVLHAWAHTAHAGNWGSNKGTSDNCGISNDCGSNIIWTLDNWVSDNWSRQLGLKKTGLQITLAQIAGFQITGIWETVVSITGLQLTMIWITGHKII